MSFECNVFSFHKVGPRVDVNFNIGISRHLRISPDYLMWQSPTQRVTLPFVAIPDPAFLSFSFWFIFASFALSKL